MRHPQTEIPSADVEALDAATQRNPFSVFRPHAKGARIHLCTYQPNAQKVQAVAAVSGKVLANLEPSSESSNLFVSTLDEEVDYRLRIDWGGDVQETEDPYAFGPLLGDVDLHLIGEGKHY